MSDPSSLTRLYYVDSLRQTFDATVLSCTPAGDRAEVVLDQTAFYPTSGGQPHDIGMLGGVRVLDVVDRDDEVVVHVVERPLGIGARVTGTIDWTRRLDHMQQHTGQHVLSAAFDRLFGIRTVSFHMGADGSTIDLARELSAAQMDDAERFANDVVWRDLDVVVRFATEEEASRMPLRKDPVRTGLLRLVEVPGIDLSACGGTHVTRTGAIGLIAISGSERFKGGTRIGFVCGDRARRSHARLRDACDKAARLLSAALEDLPGSIERLQTDLRAATRANQRLAEELAGYRGAALAAAAETVGGIRVVLRAESGDGAALKALASSIVGAGGLVAILVGDGQPAPVVAARSADVTVDAGAWVKAAIARFGGRGGGRPELAQGGVPADAPAVLEFARSWLGGQS